ncbi:MAG TPA: alpha/beta hydrolase [Acidimicrobiaceae bacterium]|nr:alpha/beta hydrolase [Acidimicrobiaceae bacterium]
MVDLEREYSPSSRAGGSAEPHVQRYRDESERAATTIRSSLQTSHGSLVVPAGTGAPLLVFVHGGYWQALSASASLFLGPGAAAAGWAYAAIEYTIAPEGSIEQMVGEVAAELAAVSALAPAPSHIVVAGHSAGAHLVAMATLAAVPPVAVDRVVLVSGVFDLIPLVRTTVNEALGLTEAAAMALSPQFLPVEGVQSGRPETVVVWGDADTSAFRAQSRHYAERLAASGVTVTALECAGRHHFDVVDDLVAPTTALGAATLGPFTP